MKILVSPGRVAGSIIVPPSKSYGQRALAAALLRPGETLIQGVGQSADELAALRVIQQLGARVTHTEQGLSVTGGLQPISNQIDCGESGLCARLFLPIAALCEKSITVTGSGTLLQRPMLPALNTLRALGVQALSDKSDGCLPVRLRGPLQLRDCEVDGSLSSQFLSGLLFACAAAATEKITIKATNLNSHGYARMSVAVLQAFGYDVIDEDLGRFVIRPAPLAYSGRYQVPGDFSSAASLLLAGAFSGPVTVSNLDPYSLQPDAIFPNILQQAGAAVSWQGAHLTVGRGAHLTAFDADATHAPDLFPVLAVLASQCTGTSRIKGLHRLVHKESNRAESISALLTAFQVKHDLVGDNLVVHGPVTLKAATVSSYNDHRIAMAAAVGALVADGPVMINGAASVQKSYPYFFKDLQSLGASLTTVS